MTISYPINLPNYEDIDSYVITAENLTRASQSEYNFKNIVSSFEDGRWKLNINLRILTSQEVGKWIAFLVKLKGLSGSFLAPMDILRPEPTGSNLGTPLINGAQNAGVNSINVDGFPNSSNGLWLEGDFIQIGSYAYMILADVNSNGSGQATVDIFPNLRANVSDNASIITSSPKSLFRLDSNLQDWTVRKDKLFNLNFTAIEKL